MRIINSRDIMETIEMLTAENLDVRTVTMGIRAEFVPRAIRSDNWPTPTSISFFRSIRLKEKVRPRRL